MPWAVGALLATLVLSGCQAEETPPAGASPSASSGSTSASPRRLRRRRPRPRRARSQRPPGRSPKPEQKLSPATSSTKLNVAWTEPRPGLIASSERPRVRVHARRLVARRRELQRAGRAVRPEPPSTSRDYQQLPGLGGTSTSLRRISEQQIGQRRRPINGKVVAIMIPREGSTAQCRRCVAREGWRLTGIGGELDASGASHLRCVADGDLCQSRTVGMTSADGPWGGAVRDSGVRSTCWPVICRHCGGMEQHEQLQRRRVPGTNTSATSVCGRGFPVVKRSTIHVWQVLRLLSEAQS